MGAHPETDVKFKLETLLLLHELAEEFAMDSDDSFQAGIINRSVLESAVERANHGPFPPGLDVTIFLRVAFLLRGILQDHGFADGSKRTGLLVAFSYLLSDGFLLEPENEALRDLMIRIADQLPSVEEIAQELETRCRKLTQDELDSMITHLTGNPLFTGEEKGIG